MNIEKSKKIFDLQQSLQMLLDKQNKLLTDLILYQNTILNNIDKTIDVKEQDTIARSYDSNTEDTWKQITENSIKIKKIETQILLIENDLLQDDKLQQLIGSAISNIVTSKL
jgi:hemerythrin-like domain-containing protein